MASPANSHFDIPDLRLLPVSSLVLHEHADEKRVTRLESRLREDGFMKNPPIVAPVPDTDLYVVLDGANRTSAVQRLGCPDILAQVVDYKSDRVHLYTWYHLITGASPEAFVTEIAEVPGLTLEPTSLEAARGALAERTILAFLVLPGADGESESRVVAVDGVPGTEHHGPESSTALLNAMVDTYKDQPGVAIHRVSTDELSELTDYFDNIVGLVVFPPYTPDDILELAQTGAKVPTGITRHIISHRALRVNVPMSLLCGDQPLAEKNAWWHEQVKRKLAANELRLYQESTYLFDE